MARRRWRRAGEAAAGTPPLAEAREPRPLWSLDEVGAAAVELGLFPESCLLDSPPADGRP